MMQVFMKENADISERISKIIEFIGISRNAFAKKLGYERAQTVYDIINGKSAPSFDFLQRFALSEYSEAINLEWLITGNGEMERIVNKGEAKTTSNTEALELICKLSGENALLKKENEDLRKNLKPGKRVQYPSDADIAAEP